MAIRLGRLDHIVLQVPDIAAAHARLLALGFNEAWPVGRTWSVGLTSGVALGGINLEFSQPDEDPPMIAGLAELVFEPAPGVELSSYGRVVEKIESDPAKLAARGFPLEMRRGPQKICTNAFPAQASWPWFVCDYAPFLRELLGSGRFASPHGEVRSATVGPSSVRPRFADVSPDLSLGAFLAAARIASGPQIDSGNESRIGFSDGRWLRLESLTFVDDPMNEA